MKEKLEFQAERIEAVLSLNKVQARVTGGTVTPRWVRFEVTPRLGAKISAIKGLSEELAAALDVNTCRVSRRGATVAVEIPRDDPKPVRLLPLYKQLHQGGQRPVPETTAILGLAEDGAPLLIRLPSADVSHILVAGTTGSGKTVLLQAIALSLCMTNAPASQGSTSRHCGLVMIDPKGHAFKQMEDLPHLARPIICEMSAAAEALRSLVRLMESRDKTGTQNPRIVVVIDELADLLMVGGKDVQNAITRLTQRGRSSGIHVVAATQKPTSAVLGPLVKANFPVRLVGRVTSVEDARTAAGWAGTGAERLTGKGDFLAIAEGRVTRFQVGHVSQQEIIQVVTDLAFEARKAVAVGTASEPENGNGTKHERPSLRDIFSRFTMRITPDHVETVFPEPEPDVVEGTARFLDQDDMDALMEDLIEPEPEPEPVLPSVPPPHQDTPVDEYQRQLEAQGFDPTQSFRAACRALGVSEGGKPFTITRSAVKRMREDQGLHPITCKPMMETGRKAIQFVKPEPGSEDTDSNAPPAIAIPDMHPDGPPEEKGASKSGRGRTVALDNQGDSQADSYDPVDQCLPVVIGMSAEIRWDDVPLAHAIAAVQQIRDVMTLDGETYVMVTNVIVDTIRADRKTARVSLTGGVR